MESKHPSTLTEREEIILSAFIDDECTSVERVKAEQLLKSNPAARSFVSAMRTVASEINEARSDLGFDSVNLWDRVTARVSQEERSAVFLGSRQTALEAARASHDVVERSSWMSSLLGWFDARMAFGGLSGAVAAAGILYVISGQSGSVIGTPVNGGRIALGNGAVVDQRGLSTIALSGNIVDSSSAVSPSVSRAARPRMVFDNSARSVEVDWARGNGPLKFIQGPNDKSTIIWVKRRDKRLQSPATNVNRLNQVNEPLLRATSQAR